MAVFEIPLRGGRGSSQTVVLADVTYRLDVHWCDPLGVWVIDLSDDFGNPMISGIPMITGANLLAQYEYFDFHGILLAQSDFDWTVPPTFTDLGKQGHLYWIPLPPPPPPPVELPVSPPDRRNPPSIFEQPPPPLPVGGTAAMSIDGTANFSGVFQSPTFTQSFTLTTAQPNDVVVLLAVMNEQHAETTPPGTLPPSFTTPTTMPPLLWQQRRAISGRITNGMSGGDIFIDIELWWAIKATPGPITISLTGNPINPAFVNAGAFGVNGAYLPHPWDGDPSLPALASQWTASPLLPTVSGVSSHWTHGLGLVFEVSFEIQALTGCSFNNAASALAWDGTPWDAMAPIIPANPTSPIIASGNIQSFIGLTTLTGVFGNFFVTPIINGTFTSIGGPCAANNYLHWTLIGDVIMAGLA